ncbi:MAG: NeuD/PglB/VioB family sugar acetyltransferase [Anaerolineaceae bacterium]|nr:NeuD/PglB/VioB family sugar acetyltransferase [Anaerolineaceae bacterium]
MNSTDQSFHLPDFSFDPASIFIYGGGGHGKTLIDLVRAAGAYRIIGLVDDHLPAGSLVMGAPVLGGTKILPELYARGIRLAVNAVGGIGDVSVRLRVFDLLAKTGFSCPNLVHPNAWVETSAVLEGGVQVLVHTYVGTESTIGFGSVLNANVVISHDCRIGRCVNLSPGALLAGDVWIGDFTQVGMGATINLHARIGARVRIGNGATVKKDIPEGGRIFAGALWPPRKNKKDDSLSARED